MMKRSSSGISRSAGRVAAWRCCAARSIPSSIRRTAAGWLRSSSRRLLPAMGSRVRTAGADHPGRSVAFSPDGRLFAATGLDARVRVSSIATGQELHDLDGQADWLIAIAFSPDGRTLAAIASDNDVRFWDMSALRGSPSD